MVKIQTQNKLQEIIARIKEFKKAAKIDKAILFGSYAKGTVSEHSDLDLLLVSKRFDGKALHERFKGLWLKWKLNIPVDFIPVSFKEFNSQKAKTTIVSEALREGIVI